MTAFAHDPTSGQILLTAMFLVLGLGAGLVLILVGFAAITGDEYDPDPLDGSLYYDGADWHQPSHVRPTITEDDLEAQGVYIQHGNITYDPRPYDWAADASDQGWGDPL